MKGRARRFPRRVQVRFWADGNPENSYAGYSRNISATGMFIATIHPHRPGSRLTIEFQAEGKPFEIMGVVAHSAKVSPLLQAVRPSGMGVRFTARHAMLEQLLPEGEVEILDEEDRVVFPMYFSDAEEFVRVFDRDISNGGLFVPTSRPAELHSSVMIELNLPGGSRSMVTCLAKVVHRVQDGDGPGMGVAFAAPADVTASLEDVVEELRGAS